MKIVFLNYEYPPLGGGGGHATQMIASRLAKKHDVSVITSQFRGLPKEENLDGLKIFRIPTLRKYQDKCRIFEMLVFILSSLVFVPYRVRQLKPDVIICFFSLPTGPCAWLCHKLYRIPYVISLRGGDVPGFLPEQLEKFHKATNWLTRLIWKNSASLVANSKGLAALAKDFMKNRVVEIIPNGVDEQFLFSRPVNSNETHHAKDPLKVLAVGRLSEQKKIERLIEGVCDFKKNTDHPLELKIVGDGPKRSELEALAKARGVLNKEVHFLGWKTRSELRDIYRAADVFSLASDFEGMPNVVLEAMASSLAIVATPSPGTTELVHPGKNGDLISDRSSAGFAGVWQKLAQDSSLRQDWQQASFKLVATYTWEQVAQDYEILSEKVLELEKVEAFREEL